MNISMRASRAVIGVRGDVRVPAEEAAEVSAPVVRRGEVGTDRELSCAREMVVQREMRPSQRALLCAGYVLPLTAPSPEAVVSARHELGAVLQRDPEGRLERGPMGED